MNNQAVCKARRRPASPLVAVRRGCACGVALCVLVLACMPRASSGDEPGSKNTLNDEQLRKQLDSEISLLTARIDKSPNEVDLYSRRGDKLFFRGKFADAVRDFDKMIELQSELETSHWRRGIACFYAGQYAAAARQFEVYHTFDNVDRENGIWRYLSQVMAVGKDQARLGLLKYEKDDREPFPDVYRMFAGELSGEQVLARIREQKGLAPEELQKRLFYAELYVGLNEFVEGRRESSCEHLREAVRNPWGAKAGGGPGWMWQAARVHLDMLEP